jgi:hypothetical protein
VSCDHHSKIAFVAVRNVAVMGHTLLGLLSDDEDSERKDVVRSAGGVAAEVLAEVISKNDLAFPRY